MEGVLGVKLLERNSRNVKLTPYGEIVIDHGQRILNSVGQLKDELNTMKRSGAGEVVIGASPILASRILGSVIGDFVRQHPWYRVDLIADDWKSLYEQLLTGAISVFFAESSGTGLAKSNDIELIPLTNFKTVFCCRPHHPIFGKPSAVRLDDLKDYPLAVPLGLPGELATAFGGVLTNGRHDKAGLIRFEQFNPIKVSLQKCDMVALVPETLISRELEEGSLVSFVPDDMPSVSIGLCAVVLKSESRSPGVYEFLNCLKEFEY